MFPVIYSHLLLLFICILLTLTLIPVFKYYHPTTNFFIVSELWNKFTYVILLSIPSCLAGHWLCNMSSYNIIQVLE